MHLAMKVEGEGSGHCTREDKEKGHRAARACQNGLSQNRDGHIHIHFVRFSPFLLQGTGKAEVWPAAKARPHYPRAERSKGTDICASRGRAATRWHCGATRKRGRLRRYGRWRWAAKASRARRWRRHTALRRASNKACPLDLLPQRFASKAPRATSITTIAMTPSRSAKPARRSSHSCMASSAGSACHPTRRWSHSRKIRHDK